MLGAIFGDIVGSVYEGYNTHNYNFPLLSPQSRPTDDSCMTLAVAKALMESYGADDDTIRASLVRNMQEMGRKYPRAGYGGSFRRWIVAADPHPYNSFGNGSAMRVAAAGWLYRTLEETLHAAELTAEVTHNHPEGIKGAQAIAAAIFLARAGASKEDIINYIAKTFEYNLFRTLDQIRPGYSFEVSCQKSCPEAIIAFFEGENYEDVIRKAVTLGGDSDTIACMAGAIAEAYYGMPDSLKKAALDRLDWPMKKIVRDFRDFYHKYSGKPEDGWQEYLKPEIDPFMQLNPLIEERIEEYYKDPEAEDAAIPVVQAILQAMSLDGHVLIPVETPEAAAKAFDPAKLTPGDTVTVEEELHWKLIQINHEDGSFTMPVFTSSEKMDEAGLFSSTLSMSFEGYMEQVLSAEGARGIVLNPGEQCFFLNKDVIRFLLDEFRAKKTTTHTVGKGACFMIPENVPEGFEEFIGEFFKNNLADQVEKVWFTGLSNQGENSWLFAIATDAEDMQPIYDRIHTMMVLMKVNTPVDYMRAKEQPWPGARLVFGKEA